MPADAPDDPTLVARLAAGDDDALAALYRRHGGAVYGLARRVLRDGAAAEEIAQVVFLALWEHPHRYDAGRGTVAGFLLAMTHSRCLDRLRADRARRAREERDHRAGTPLATPEEVGGWVATAGAAVRRALGQLPEQERLPLVAAYYGGYTYRQVAELLGHPEGTVKSRIRAGMDHLRAILEADGEVGR